MGSIGMDKDADIAVGYSVSSHIESNQHSNGGGRVEQSQAGKREFTFAGNSRRVQCLLDIAELPGNPGGIGRQNV
jgi:hypothetical protein